MSDEPMLANMVCFLSDLEPIVKGLAIKHDLDMTEVSLCLDVLRKDMMQEEHERQSLETSVALQTAMARRGKKRRYGR